ncbi:nicotinamide-nucleotide adenylyltransferase [Malassezia nana]|uniref:Nicotinamide-nucleotide adenylyltransferase n=1 Tax=Malassezia nana TaxID=180528 RepID=A0AAF0J313_9BASI|nr:nicotinamide-nucleotide adenylyltransferase [Malassezia nana]
MEVVTRSLGPAASEAWRCLGPALEQFLAEGQRFRMVYASQNTWPVLPASSERAHIAVLDASFNPPTRAHAGLAHLHPSSPARQFDAHLLLFSVRNADKGRGRPGDATPLQRLQMMLLLAQHLEQSHMQVAVALVDEPLVFAKSTLLHKHLSTTAPLRLHWLMGSDTLVRVFQPKYYASETALAQACDRFFDQEQSRMICAERSPTSVQGTAGLPGASAPLTQATSPEMHELLAQNALARHWLDKGGIALHALDPDVARHSSTAVRTFLREAEAQGMNQADVTAALHTMVPAPLVPYLAMAHVYSAPRSDLDG